MAFYDTRRPQQVDRERSQSPILKLDSSKLWSLRVWPLPINIKYMIFEKLSSVFRNEKGVGQSHDTFTCNKNIYSLVLSKLLRLA